MPRVVEPSLKVTVPVGAVPAPELTVAVKVTAWPKTEGLGVEAASAVVVTVAAWLTAWLSAVEVLAVKLLSPP